MPTTTLFQTLKLNTGTWTIEIVYDGAPARDDTGAVKGDDVRNKPPADPWWDKAHTTIIKEVIK